MFCQQHYHLHMDVSIHEALGNFIFLNSNNIYNIRIFMVDPHYHTKHSSCKISPQHILPFFFAGRKVSTLMFSQKTCKLIYSILISHFKEFSERQSQNHLVWKVPLDIIMFNSLFKQSHLKGMIQDHIQTAFNIIKDGDSTTSTINLFLRLISLILYYKNFFFGSNSDSLIFRVLITSSPVSHQTLLRKPTMLLLHFFPIRYLYTLTKLPLSFSFSRLNNPSYLSLSSYERCSSPSSFLQPFFGLTPICPCFFHAGQPRPEPSTADIALPVPRRGQGPLALTSWQHSS